MELYNKVKAHFDNAIVFESYLSDDEAKNVEQGKFLLLHTDDEETRILGVGETSEELLALAEIDAVAGLTEGFSIYDVAKDNVLKVKINDEHFASIVEEK